MKRSDRLPVLSGAFLAMLAGCLVLLGGAQVVHGAAYLDRAQRTTLSVETVPAARGRLLDRDGRTLAEDRASWSVVLDEGTTAAVRARLVQLCRAAGLAWDGTGGGSTACRTPWPSPCGPSRSTACAAPSGRRGSAPARWPPMRWDASGP